MQFSKQSTNGLKYRQKKRTAATNTLVVIAVLVSGTLAGAWFVSMFGSRPTESTTPTKKTDAPKKKYPVTIRRPLGPPRVDTGITDFHGKPVTVSCSSCHATRQPNFKNKVPADLNEFHGSIKVAHGNISCLSCHNSKDYDALKLADGSRVAYQDVMTLCAQCHGPQMRDYEHGAHGGYTGHWDLTRGPRTKNNCVDCHNPHSPKFPQMQPSFKPRDRFLKHESHGDGP